MTVSKITITVLASLFIAFVIVFSVYTLNGYMIKNQTKFLNDQGELVLEKDFLSKADDINENRIFVIGSSHVQPLNTTYIHNYLLMHNLNYTVYNFGEGRDTPQDTLTTIDDIISTKPKIIIYGISYRDFDDSSTSDTQATKPISGFPDPSYIFKKMLTVNVPYAVFDSLKDPEVTIYSVMENVNIIQNTDKNYYFPFPNTPFVYYGKKSDIPPVLTDAELNKYYSKNQNLRGFYGIKNVEINYEVISLKRIISDIRNHNIKLIIFTTPQSKYFLKTLTNSDKENFDLILKEIRSEFNMRIYQLNDNYTNLNIWKDPTHVAINENITIYNEDISKIILQDLMHNTI